jgi:fibronectin-binding autotransporter adhesin
MDHDCSSDNENVGLFGKGTLVQTGGTNTIANNLNLGGNSLTLGTYNLSNSGQLFANNENIGVSGTGTFSQTGGMNSVTSFLYLGENSNSTGTYNLSDTAQLFANIECIGQYGRGTFNQSGGINTVSNSLELGYQSFSRGTYNLTGGKLILKSLTEGSGGNYFNFGGGTLQASGDFTAILPITLTGDGGNANIDTASHSVTLSGILSGAGGINKLGSGTLTLNAKETFIGDTTVSGGTLIFSGGIDPVSTSLIDVQSGKAILETVNVNKPNLNIKTAPLATFEVLNGSHTVGAISGSGTTQIDAGASLTVTSIYQNTLTMGNGATLTIQAIPGGLLGGTITSVPEPATLVLLAGTFVMLALLKAIRPR